MFISFVLNLGAELVGKKWRAVVIWHLKDGPLRFSELKARIPQVSVKVLTEVLREMTENHLLTRTQFNTIPVKVLYEIHPDAADIVEANAVCTLKIAEHIVKNHARYEISENDLEDLTEWIRIHTDLIKVTVSLS